MPWFDKVLDAALIVGVTISIIFFVGSFFSPSKEFIHAGYGVDVVIIGLLTADMSRHFLRSKNFLDFAKHHWFDIVLLFIVVISFSSLLYLGFGRLSWLIREEEVLGEAGKLSRLRFFGKIFR